MVKRDSKGRFVKGSISWNTGLTKKEDVRIPQPWLNKKRSEKTKEKIRESKLGKKCPKASETKKRLYKEGKLKPWNKGLKGVIKSWCKGLTKETSEGIRSSAEKRKGRKRPEEIIRKGVETRMKNGSYKRSKETIIKTALANTGKKRSEKTKKKMRLAQLGTKASDETRKKMGKLKIKYYEEHPEDIEEMRKRRAKQILPTKDTKIEVKIQNFLKSLGIEFFTHQHMNIKHNYQCDILIPSMNLVIECDGNYWHKYPVGLDIDHIRTKELIKKGFKVLRLWEFEINEMSIKEFKNRLRV